MEIRAVRREDRTRVSELMVMPIGVSPDVWLALAGSASSLLSEVAVDGGVVIGAVDLRGTPSGVPLAILDLVVDPDRRGKGVGSALWRRTLTALAGGMRVRTSTQGGDEHSMQVLTSWGFTVVGEQLRQRRSLTEPIPHVKPPDGFAADVVSGVVEGDYARRLGQVMALSVEGLPDTTGTGDSALVAPMLAILRAQPGGATTVFATRYGVDVGYSVAFRDGDGWHIADTAVLPQWRQRGVAGWIKTVLTEQAVNADAHSILTFNDIGDEPILRLNERQGYVTEARRVFLLRDAPTRT